MPLLLEAARNFLNSAAASARSRFDNFAEQNHWWLEDFVLYDALRHKYERRAWKEWPAGLARHDAEALVDAKRDLADEMQLCRVLQFFFWEQWRALRRACAERSIRVVGDIAIFVDYDSADVWSHRELYRLKENLDPEVVSGVPPDAFSADGQRWGNPLYNWDKMRQDGYHWWIQRLRWAALTCDYIRLDHFRGFAQFWEIPADEPTAIHGRWVDGPSDDLFVKLRESLGALPFFAEDLGVITPDVNALRERLHIPGMAVLQFGFGDAGAHIYLPHRLTHERVIYTGTHDNDTTLGWWNSIPETERGAVQALVGRSDDGVNWSLIRAAQGSVADFSIFPVQDILGLGSEARLNVPSRQNGNYLWRMQPGVLTRDIAEKLARLAEVSDRLPQPIPAHSAEDFAA